MVDSRCYGLTAGYVRAKAARAVDAAPSDDADDPGPERVATCPFFEQLEENGRDVPLPAGIYSLDELKHYGKTRGWCPYFVARRAVSVGVGERVGARLFGEDLDGRDEGMEKVDNQ